VRAVVQRVRDARVSVDGEVVGRIERGLLAYVGFHKGDGEVDAEYVAEKIAAMRVFEDGEGRMNRSVVDESGGVLVGSQFPLYADARKGRRPSLSEAAGADLALPLYEDFLGKLRSRVGEVSSGVFRAHMEVSYVNSGPVTVLLDSKRLF